MHAGAQIESFSEAENVPLETIGQPIGRRRAANDWRVRAAAPVYAADEDELLLEEEAARCPGAVPAVGVIGAPDYSLAATTSTSINASGRAKAEMTNSVDAGASLPRNWAPHFAISGNILPPRQIMRELDDILIAHTG